jgi:hypothetical protein
MGNFCCGFSSTNSTTPITVPFFSFVTISVEHETVTYLACANQNRTSRMQPIARAFTRTTLAPWTCTRCTPQSQTTQSIRGYATGGRYTAKARGKPKRGRVVLAAATGTLGLTALVFQDEAKHAYRAVERTGRVAGTLALCINE